MRQLKAVEAEMSSAWRIGMRDGDWTGMESGVRSALVDAYWAGRRLHYPTASEPIDSTRFIESARAMVHRATVEAGPLREKVADYYGYTMLATLFLLFFDEEDAGVFEPLERGIPSRTARRAARSGVTLEMARRAHEVMTRDSDIRTLVRTVPMRSEAVALDEARRSFNLGIAESALGEQRNSASRMEPGKPATYEASYPLWRISEVMDDRTRGNPNGRYRHDGFHWQVNGYINTMSEIVRQGCVPPCGRNCRAVLKPVSWKAAELLGLVGADGALDYAAIREYNGIRQSYIDRGLYPDRAFV